MYFPLLLGSIGKVSLQVFLVLEFLNPLTIDIHAYEPALVKLSLHVENLSPMLDPDSFSHIALFAGVFVLSKQKSESQIIK